MCRGMRKPPGLKVRLYAARLIYLNNYLAVLPGAKISENNCGTDLNEILLKSMPKTWSKQAEI